MNRTEHLLAILAEECAEVAQRATKALRFGLDEVQPGQDETNALRLVGEIADLHGVLEILCEENRTLHDCVNGDGMGKMIEAKKAKVERFLAYSEECGTLTGRTQGEETTDG